MIGMDLEVVNVKKRGMMMMLGTCRLLKSVDVRDLVGEVGEVEREAVGLNGLENAVVCNRNSPLKYMDLHCPISKALK
jgi:hypothetical protein